MIRSVLLVLFFVGSLFAAVSIGSNVPAAVSFKTMEADSTVVLQKLYEQHPATVLVFLSDADDVYARRAGELAPRFQNKGVTFYAVYGGASEAQAMAHAKTLSLPFSLLYDNNLARANIFDITETPRAIILDAFGTLRFRGKIDDNADQSQIKSPWLMMALMDLLTGNQIRSPQGE